MAGIVKWTPEMVDFLKSHWYMADWSGPRISRHLGLQNEAAYGKAMALRLPIKREAVRQALPPHAQAMPKPERIGHGPHPLPVGHALAMAVLYGECARFNELRA